MKRSPSPRDGQNETDGLSVKTSSQDRLNREALADQTIQEALDEAEIDGLINRASEEAAAASSGLSPTSVVPDEISAQSRISEAPPLWLDKVIQDVIKHSRDLPGFSAAFQKRGFGGVAN